MSKNKIKYRHGGLYPILSDKKEAWAETIYYLLEKKETGLTFTQMRNLAQRGDKRIPSNELTDTLMLLMRRCLVKKEGNRYFSQGIGGSSIINNLSKRIKAHNRPPFHFLGFDALGIEGKEVPVEFVKNMDKLRKDLVEVEKDLRSIQMKEFKTFFDSFIKGLPLDFRLALKRLEESLCFSITHHLSSKTDFLSHEFLTFVSILFYTDKNSKTIFNEFNDNERIEFLKILEEFWHLCPVSNILLFWQQQTPRVDITETYNALSNKYGTMIEKNFKEDYSFSS